MLWSSLIIGFFNTLTTNLVQTTECITYRTLTSARFEEACCRFSLYLTEARPPWVNIDIAQWDGADSEHRNQSSYTMLVLWVSPHWWAFFIVSLLSQSSSFTHELLIHKVAFSERLFYMFLTRWEKRNTFFRILLIVFCTFSRCDWKHIRPLRAKGYILPTEPIFR